MIRVARLRARRADGAGRLRGGRGRRGHGARRPGPIRRSASSSPRCSASADVVVDFTTPETALDNVAACLEAGVHAVVGTTGFDLDALREAAESPASANCFVAPNFAIGAVLLMEVAQRIAPHMPECEIVELHHDRSSTRRRGRRSAPPS